MRTINVQGTVHHLGWKKDRPDHRDHLFAPHIDLATLPQRVDLRPQCSPIVDQGQLGCHDDKTEVLTELGWKRWTDYEKGALATINPQTQLLEFQHPIALQRYDYNGPMHFIDHGSLDYALTPNHRMFVRPWVQQARTLSDDYVFKPVSELGWYQGLLAAPMGWVGTEVGQIKIGQRVYSGDDFVALVALVVSDGWVANTDNNRDRVSFCCFRADRQDKVRALAKRLEISEIQGRPGVWWLRDGALAQWLKAKAYVGDCYQSPFKRVPLFVQELCARQIELFLDFYGDQHVDGNRQFYTSSDQIRDDLQELLLRVGKRSGIYTRPMRDSTMRDGRMIRARESGLDHTITEWRTDNLSIDRKKMTAVDHYKGEVFCATVPNSTLVTRRNGQVLISGNSCTANSTTSMMESLYVKIGREPPVLSRLFVYYVSRVEVEGGDPTDDSGCQIRDVMKALASYGAALESTWPYDTDKFSERPPTAAFESGKNHEITRYQRCVGLNGVLGALASGYCTVIGFSVPENMESAECARTGVVQYPMPDEAIIGGHAIMLVGYDKGSQMLVFQNSWGTSWGNKGYGYLPFAFVTNGLADDCWILKNEMMRPGT